MKKLYLIICSGFLSVFAMAQTTHPSGITGCIGRWDFASSGTVSSLPDVSGNNNNGYVRGSITADADFRGVNNRAMWFNGYDSYIAVPSSSSLGPSNITMMAIVKFDDFYNGYCNATNILNKGVTDYMPGAYGLVAYDHPYDGSCGIYSPERQQLGVKFGDATASITPPAAGNYFQTSKWYLVVSSFDGAAIVKYQIRMDSAYNPSVAPVELLSAPPTAMGTNTDSLTFGALKNPNYPYWLKGDLDEIALFNKVLTNSEMQFVYDYLWGKVAINNLSNTRYCKGEQFSVSYTTSNATMCQPGNVFTVQLSDANGSFQNPTNIGSVAAVSSGVITCTIPNSVTAGTGYRMRIATSLPAYLNIDNGSNIEICSSLSVANAAALTGITIAPNPSYGVMRIQGNTPGTNAVLEVYNTLGQRVYTTSTAAPNHKLDATIQLDKALANGLYQIRVSSEGKAFTSTISLQQ